MFKNRIQDNIRKLYAMSAFGSFSLGGASWVALLAARGFSMVEIGIGETVFHITSLLFEIPSGVLADVLGRKKMLIASHLMAILSSVVMILSRNFFEVAVALVFSALSYNFASGSGDALAYDGLKVNRMESEYDKYMARQMMIYRISNGAALLCVGLALLIGYKVANLFDAIINVICLVIACTLVEAPASTSLSYALLPNRIKNCFMESYRFLIREKRARNLMLCNSLIEAMAILLGFFLQAKLPMAGLPKVLLGPALFLMGMGGMLGAKVALLLKPWNYRSLALLCVILCLLGILSEWTGICLLMCIGGFLATFSDDLIQVRSNTLLNEMIPSSQRATLMSVSSFCFSVVMIVLSPLAGLLFSN